jgi:hypothetical protein
MWIVMTSAAHMPNSCKGRYRRVALVQLSQYYTANNLEPKMISERARGVLRLIDMGHHNVGTTPRCAYHRTLVTAHARVDRLNNEAPEAVGDLLSSWGSA